MTGRLFLQNGGGGGQDGEFVAADYSDLTGSAPPQPSFPSGTIMLFQQTAAPTGWTKITTSNDVGLRVVSGTVGSVTGQTAFSTVFGQTTTGAHALSQAELPNVNLNMNGNKCDSSGSFGGSSSLTGSFVAGNSTFSAIVSLGGSGTAHSHTVALNLNYIDLILASKN